MCVHHLNQGAAETADEEIADQGVGLRSKSVLTSFDLVEGRLRGAGAQLLAEFTCFADRCIDRGLVVVIESHRAMHICQRNTVVVGGCLRAAASD